MKIRLYEIILYSDYKYLAYEPIDTPQDETLIHRLNQANDYIKINALECSGYFGYKRDVQKGSVTYIRRSSIESVCLIDESEREIIGD